MTEASNRGSWDGSVEFIDAFCDRQTNTRFFKKYNDLFQVKEIADTPVLQWALGAFLLACVVAFHGWVSANDITIEAYRSNDYFCWPYFQDCGRWYFLQALPFGYSQTIFYSGLLAVAVLSIFLMWRRKWVLAHLFVTTLWIWKFLVVLIFTPQYSGNYEYYDLILGATLLFFPHKEFFLRAIFVFLYFLASTIKLSDGWVAGTYFTSLASGLPIFGDSFTPIITNLVILMQMVGAWFLLSRNPILQRFVFIYFLLFHFYSGILVAYRYMLTSIPWLIILFGPLYRPLKVPTDWKVVPGVLLITVLLALQMIAVFGSPDRQSTLENNRYGLYMFEANHQCISETTAKLVDGKTKKSTSASGNARLRCDPYLFWFKLKQECKRNEEIESIAWTFDHSTNGGPFYRIIDTSNVCSLSYKASGHNEWIHTPEDGAPISGYPSKNYYK